MFFSASNVTTSDNSSLNRAVPRRFDSVRRFVAALRGACGAAAARFNHFAAASALSAALLVGADAAAQSPSEDAAAEDAIVLIAFGDSLVAGYGLPQSDGFVPQLQAWLAENGADDVIVINAGVSGDTTSAGLARLDWSIGPDADAVLLELGGNDALRGVDPAIARSNLDQMLARLGDRDLPVLLAGMTAPNNWGPEYVEAFEAMYPELAEKHSVPLYEFFFDGVFEDADYFQDDRIHPNAEGVSVIVESIGPYILALVEDARARRAQ